MGYGCPTTGSCSTSNFFSQIDSGAWVLRYHYERANGNTTWWNNGGYTCGNPSIFYNPGLNPGQNITFIDEDGVPYKNLYLSNAATASFYCYTPHTYNNPSGLYGLPISGTTGRYYSGSYNFVINFERWFGSSQSSPAFKSSSNSTIYFSINGYKLVVPQMAVLQDHGISPESIQTVSQSIADSIPAPPIESGISTTLGHIVKTTSDSDADGGSIYVISVGKRYQLSSMEQFNKFGFSEANISYLPYDYVTGIKSGGILSNYVTTPQTAVFEVDNSKKRLIFEYSSFIQRNPSGSSSMLSYYLADSIPSGKPISDRPILFKYNNSSLVYIYNNSNYYPVNTYDAFSCWGLNTGRIPLYAPILNGYVEPIVPSNEINCVVKGPTLNDTSIISRGKRLSVPESYELFLTAPYFSDIYALSNQINPSGGILRKYIKSSDSAPIWLIETGQKRIIPSYSSFKKLVPDGSSFDTLSPSVVSSIDTGAMKLAEGSIVKSNTSPAVNIIIGNQRLLYGYNEFVGYRNSWANIETYPAATLDAAYPSAPTMINKYLLDRVTDKVYLVDPNGCFLLSNSLLTDFGKNKTDLSISQGYEASSFTSLNVSTCLNGSTFVKQPGQSTVYWISGGTKHLISKWTTLVQKAGTNNPYVITVAPEVLNDLVTGDPLN